MPQSLTQYPHSPPCTAYRYTNLSNQFLFLYFLHLFVADRPVSYTHLGQCSRSFYIGEGVEQKDIRAKFEDGILKLSVPKKEQPKLDTNKYISIEG